MTTLGARGTAVVRRLAVIMRRARRLLAAAFREPDRLPAPQSRLGRVSRWLPLAAAPIVVGLFLDAPSDEYWPGVSPILTVSAVVCAVAVALFGHFPLMSWRIVFFAYFAWVCLGPMSSNGAFYPPNVLAGTLMVSLLVVGFRCRRGVFWGAWAWTTLLLLLGSGGDAIFGYVAVLTGASFVVDAGRQSARARAVAGAERLARVEQEAQGLLLQERARIARDLHDVVAHHMSMVAVQAETAQYRLRGLDDAVRDEFASIAGSARAALADVRGILAVLRADGAAGGERAPQPTLDDLGSLVDAARSAGADVVLDVVGEPRPLGTALEIGAYRIVQESLANAARHAPGAAVSVELVHAENALAVTVRNDAPPGRPVEPDAELSPGGHGLVGMRERAALLGGELAAGRTARGGFLVTVRLPTEGAES